MIHIVYPHLNKISTPNVIGYKLIEYLSKNNTVRAYNWDSFSCIIPSPGDILIGHVCPAPFTIMRRSLKQPGWHKKIIMQPYAEDINQVGFLDEFIEDCDLFLAITGKYWFDRIDQSIFSPWKSKMIHLNLAVDSKYFPIIKTKFNPIGQRRLVYVGNDYYFKNLDYLEEISKLMPEVEIHTIGKINRSRRFINHGFLDFSTDTSKSLIAQFDFMITVGFADANPTTILESMSWGLIPICTPTSGYEGVPGIVNIPLADAKVARDIINYLNNLPDQELIKLQELGKKTVLQNYSWNIFCKTVESHLDVGVQKKKSISNSYPLIPAKLKRNYSQSLTYFVKAILKNLQRMWFS